MPKAAQSLYDVLNVSPGADPAVIEAAYRALMKRHHPDHAGNAAEAETAAAINNAYAVLRSPERRADYDRRTDAERRDRAAQAHARLVAMQGAPPPARRANLFAWSGWLVAAGACGVLAYVPRQGVSVPAKAVASAGLTAAPGKGSQPAPAEPDMGVSDLDLAAASVAVAPAAALAAPVAVEPPPAIEPATRAAPARVAARSAPRARPQRPAQRRASARASRPPEIDFLEREGYIY